MSEVETEKVRNEVDNLRRALRDRQKQVESGNTPLAFPPDSSVCLSNRVSTDRSPTTSSIRTAIGRSLTFTSVWPHPHYVNLRPQHLAAAGFFFSPTQACPDRVTCVYCGLEIGGFTLDSNVAVEVHRQGNPACPFLSRLVTDNDDPAGMQSRPRDSLRQEMIANKTAKKDSTPPQLVLTTWLVNNYADVPEEQPTHVLVRNQSLSNEVTVEITGKPPHGCAVRTLELLDSSYVRVLADGVVLKVVISNCNYVELVLGGRVPHVVINNTTSCVLTVCSETMDQPLETSVFRDDGPAARLETSNSSGVAVQLIAHDLLRLVKHVSRCQQVVKTEGSVRPTALLEAVENNSHDTVLIPERMKTIVNEEMVETRLEPLFGS